MIVYFNCSPKTKRLMDHLIEQEAYSDHSELMEAAIDHLAFLHKQVGSVGSLFIERTGDIPYEDPAATVTTVRERAQHEELTTTENQKLVGVPSLFRLSEESLEPSTWGVPYERDGVPGEEIAVEDWLFGQYNRLLPAKATCRALMTLPEESRTLEEARLLITNAAVGLGDQLSRVDERRDAGRSEAFATAFPVSGKGIEKSTSRFAGQFVADQSSDGSLSGLPIELKLVGLGGDAELLKLTQPGWHFAQLPNPVLDGDPLQAGQTLSDPERQVLLDHIRESVPRELAAYQAVLAGILAKADTPNELDEFLGETSSRSDISPSFLTTQRSGAIARMIELGLIQRVRDGIRVRYRLTERGSSFSEGAD